MKGASRFELLTGLSRRDRWILGVPTAILVVGAFWLASKFLDPLPPRRVVIGAGPAHSALHALGERYRTILARDGVHLEVRATLGAGENAQLLADPASGVDVAFVVAGTVPASKADGVANVSNLFYAALWALARGERPVASIAQMRGMRIAVGEPGSGLAVVLEPLLSANDVTAANTTLLTLPASEAFRRLMAGEIDVVFSGEGPVAPAFRDAMRAPGVHVVDFRHADAYARLYPHIMRLELPPGTLDLARDIPRERTSLLGATALLGARADLHPTVIDLLVDAAREIHGGPGNFEKRGEFPNIVPVDALRVSEQALLYSRSGPSLLRRYLPLWLADFLQRVAALAIPLLVVVYPLMRWLPAAAGALQRWRILNWYADLRMVERCVREGGSDAHVGELLAEVERIDRAAAGLSGSVLNAEKIYGLRGHVRMVRESVQTLAAERLAEVRRVRADSDTLPQ